MRHRRLRCRRQSEPCLRQRRDNYRPSAVTIPPSSPNDNPTLRRPSADRRTRATQRPSVRHEARAARQRQVDRTDVQRLHRRADPGPLLGTGRRRPELLDRSQALDYGEKAGVPFAPVGIYDYTTASCTPSSPTTTACSTCCCRRPTASAARPRRACAPTCTGSSATTRACPGASTRTTSRDYRTIAAEFEAMPGIHDPGRPRPDPGRRVGAATGGQAVAVQCTAPSSVPQLLCSVEAVRDRFRVVHDQRRRVRVARGTVALDSSPITVNSWSDSTIEATVPAGTPVARISCASGRVRGSPRSTR